MFSAAFVTLLFWLFWISFFVVFYSYLGYGILLYLLVAVKKWLGRSKPPFADGENLPRVALIVAAFNEEEYIEDKILNSLELDYPADRLDMIFVTDGSTDSTPDIIGRYPRIRLLHQPERRGKAAAMNRAIQATDAPVLVFCDANTYLNKACIRKLAGHYADPRVGGVAGEKKILDAGAGAAAAGEGLYWKYESILKKLDSDLFSAMGAAGELFSVRRELFEQVPEGTIIEDFVQSLRICLRGYRLKYEPGAWAAEAPSASVREEMKRKVRICAGAFQAMILLRPMFNIFRRPVMAFQFISHRVLRWTICPVALILLFISNILIVLAQPAVFYGVLLAGQTIFYLLAAIGWWLANKNIKARLVYIPFYFLFMNLAVFMGLRRFLKGKQTVLWEKAERQKLAGKSNTI